MEQSTKTGGNETDATAIVVAPGAARRVYLGIMEGLEQGTVVPGQRLIETDLAQRFSVGRNAVREAMQRLAARGVIDVSRNRSGAIRMLDKAETLEILDVAEVLTGLVSRVAAARIGTTSDAHLLSEAIRDLADPQTALEPALFSRARRHFYRALLTIGENRELKRLFPAIGMHIIYSQYRSPILRKVRLADYEAVHDAVMRGDCDAADAVGRLHVCHVRQVIIDLTANII